MPNNPNRLLAAQRELEKARKLAAQRATKIAHLESRLNNPVLASELENQRLIYQELKREVEKVRAERDEFRKRVIKLEENVRVLESYFGDVEH